MSKTDIEWTHAPGFDGETWNPTLGCDKVSPGCKFCYAIRSVNRMAGNPNPKIAAANAGLVVMTGAGLNWTGKVNAIESRLSVPLKKKKPTTWFVNSLSDLFHEDIHDEFITNCLAVMALCPHHRFMILTKRATQMQKYFSFPDARYRISIAASNFGREYYRGKDASKWHYHEWTDPAMKWPLPNVWLGVSVENQATADERIPLLLKTPAAVRFVSYEPALGPVNFETFICADWRDGTAAQLPKLDQIIVGGESGPGARPFNLRWAHRTIGQCKGAHVACFVKQLGAKPGTPSCASFDCTHPDCSTKWLKLQNKKGGDWSDPNFPEALKVREFPG